MDNRIIIILKILLFIGISVGLYFVTKSITNSFKTTCASGFQFNQKENRCVIQCSDDQVNDPDNIDQCIDCSDKTQQKVEGCGCITPCQADQTLCNCKCISDIDYTCLNNDTPCYRKSVYYPSGPTGPASCCPDGQIASSIGLTGPNIYPSSCVSITCATGTKLCGDKCCPNSQSCCGNKCCPPGQDCDGSNNCCPVENLHDGSCCKNYSTKNKSCCPDDPSIIVKDDGLCYVHCGDNVTGVDCEWDADAKEGQICGEKSFVDNNGNITVKQAYCLKKPACQVQSLTANPTNLKKDSQQSENKVPVCELNNDPTLPKASCKVSDITKYSKTYMIRKDPDGGSVDCQYQDCVNLLSNYDGIMTINTVQDQNDKFSYCEAPVACIAAEGTKEPCADCPVFTDDGKPSPQCCMNDDGKYSGYVCEQDYACYKDPLNNNEFRCADSVYSGPDTGYQCKYGNKSSIDTKINYIYEEDRNKGKTALQVCEDDKSFYRCGENALNSVYRLVNGKCYYYNPVLDYKNNPGCDNLDSSGSRCKATNTSTEYNNNDRTNLNTEYIVDFWKGNVEVGEITTGIPYGLYYGVATELAEDPCDGNSYSDRRCNGCTYYMCDNKTGDYTCDTLYFLQNKLNLTGGSWSDPSKQDGRQYWDTSGRDPIGDSHKCSVPTS